MTTNITAFFVFCHLVLSTGCAAQTKKDTGAKNKSITTFYNDFSKNNWLIVKVVIDHDTGTFVLDNGTSEKLYLDKQMANKINLKNPQKSTTLKDSSFSTFTATTPVYFSVGSIKDTSNQTIVYDFRKTLNKDIDGIIGINFLNKYILEIDYINNYFSFYKSLVNDTLLYQKIKLKKGKGPGVQIPVSFFINDKKYSDWGIIDLGMGSEGIYSGTGFIKRNNLQLKKTDSTVRNRFVTGNKTKSYHTTIDSLQIENRVVNNVLLQWTDEKSGPAAQDYILIGNSFLKRFGKLYIDFQNLELYIKKETVSNHRSNSK